MNDAGDILVLAPADDSGRAEEFAGRLGGAQSLALEPAGGAGAKRMAAALVAAEAAIAEPQGGARPGAVVLCGSGPEVGAAALVTAKLEVPLARVAAAPRGEDDAAALADLDGQVAERLADISVEGEDGADRIADRIRAWLST